MAMLSQSVAETVNVTLITASDMDTMSGKKRGGVARLAAVVKSERAKGGNSVFVYPGDLLSPSILSGFDKGAHMVELLNMAPPDILVPGNHEYDFGPEIFIQRMNEGNFAKLATNTRYKNGDKIPGFEDTKLMDFGIAQLQNTSQRTQTGAAMGTAYYMAPEQLAGGDLGPWTDHYAVGVVLYRMLVGKSPFVGSPAEMIAAHLRDPVPALPTQLGLQGLDPVINRTMAKKPADRYADGAALIAALDNKMV